MCISSTISSRQSRKKTATNHKFFDMAHRGRGGRPAGGNRPTFDREGPDCAFMLSWIHRKTPRDDFEGESAQFGDFKKEHGDHPWTIPLIDRQLRVNFQKTKQRYLDWKRTGGGNLSEQLLAQAGIPVPSNNKGRRAGLKIDPGSDNESEGSDSEDEEDTESKGKAKDSEEETPIKPSAPAPNLSGAAAEELQSAKTVRTASATYHSRMIQGQFTETGVPDPDDPDRSRTRHVLFWNLDSGTNINDVQVFWEGPGSQIVRLKAGLNEEYLTARNLLGQLGDQETLVRGMQGWIDVTTENGLIANHSIIHLPEDKVFEPGFRSPTTGRRIPAGSDPLFFVHVNPSTTTEAEQSQNSEVIALEGIIVFAFLMEAEEKCSTVIRGKPRRSVKKSSSKKASKKEVPAPSMASVPSTSNVFAGFNAFNTNVDNKHKESKRTRRGGRKPVPPSSTTANVARRHREGGSNAPSSRRRQRLDETGSFSEESDEVNETYANAGTHRVETDDGYFTSGL